MDQILRSELDSIARDRSSGAAELALRACNALEKWCRREKQPSQDELLEIARKIFHVQPSMSSLARVANEVALACEDRQPTTALKGRIRALRRILQDAAEKIAGDFARWLALRAQPEIFTYSYSSTVLAALVRAHRNVWGVSCSESRPGNEGIAMASKLARAKIRTTFMTDAGLFSQLWGKEIVVLGADAVLNGWVAGKVGIRALTARARQLGCPVIFLADTTKFWPEPRGNTPRLGWTWAPDATLWKTPPPRVHVYNLLIEFIPLAPSFRFVTEKGWMTPVQVRREIDKIRISPRLKALAETHN